MPQANSDISSFSYSFSFEQNPNWSRLFAPGEELKNYANHCVEKYKLNDKFRFNTSVTKAEYDEDHHVWTICLADGGRIVTRYIFSCTGPLSQPKSSDIKGLNEFAGKVIHPARWDHGYDIKNKDAHDQYYRKVLRREKNNVMLNNDCTGANSYYFDDNGDAAYLRPSSGLEMWWHSRHFPLKHYQFI